MVSSFLFLYTKEEHFSFVVLSLLTGKEAVVKSWNVELKKECDILLFGSRIQ